jgi:hypothetical protein
MRPTPAKAVKPMIGDRSQQARRFKRRLSVAIITGSAGLIGSEVTLQTDGTDGRYWLGWER